MFIISTLISLFMASTALVAADSLLQTDRLPQDQPLHLFGTQAISGSDGSFHCVYKAGIGPDEFFTATVRAPDCDAARVVFVDSIVRICEAASKPIPAHIQIMMCVDRLTPRIIHGSLSDLTPQSVYDMIGSCVVRNDPRMLFAIRSKLIIAWIMEQSDDTATSGSLLADDTRVNIFLGEILPRVMQSLDPSVRATITEHTESVMPLIFACPQMTPHIVFSAANTNLVAEITAYLPEYFVGVRGIHDELLANMAHLETMAVSKNSLERHKQIIAQQQMQVAALQMELDRESEARVVVREFTRNPTLSNAVNSFITALRNELIAQHALNGSSSASASAAA